MDKVCAKINEWKLAVKNTPGIEAGWTEMNENKPFEGQVEIKAETQTSRNLVAEVGKLMNDVNRTAMVTNGTVMHDQKDTNLCHSFGINSGLRKALVNLVEGRKSEQVRYGYGASLVVKKDKEGLEIFNDNSEWGDGHNICSFQAMLSNLIGNVNPTSFFGLDGDTLRKSSIAKQATRLDKVIDRLTSKTLLEDFGWKRILGAVKFLESFGLNPDHYDLEAVKVSHPNSAGIPLFQEGILRDHVETSMKNAWFKEKLDECQMNFVVSHFNRNYGFRNFRII